MASYFIIIKQESYSYTCYKLYTQICSCVYTSYFSFVFVSKWQIDFDKALKVFKRILAVLTGLHADFLSS